MRVIALLLVVGLASAALRKQDIDTARLVSAIQQVVTNMEAEQEAAKEMQEGALESCKGNRSSYEDAINKNHRNLANANADLQAAAAEAEDLQASIDGIKGEITGSGNELDSLQGKLSDLRQTIKNSTAETAASLQQLRQAVSKGATKSQTKQKHHHHHHRHGSHLNKKVSSLRELSEELAASEKMSSFLQMDSTQDQDVAKQEMEQDQEAVTNAGDAARDQFDEEEKRLLELIRLEREKLEKSEKNLQSKQPALADALAEVADANRTVVDTTRALVRDGKLIEDLQTMCDMRQTASTGQIATRDQVLQQLHMAVKMLESLDAALFLAKDIHGLKDNVDATPESFVQVSSKRSGPMADKSTQDIQSLISSITGGSHSNVLELIQQGASQQSGSEGPFDQVTQMISALVDNLKNEANADVDHHQFCMDNQATNRRNRLIKVDQIDMKKSEIRWAQAAVTKLDDEIAWIEAEIARMQADGSRLQKDLDGLKSNIDAQLANHKDATDVVNEVVTVLTQLCELETSAAPGFVQRQVRSTGRSGKSGKFSRCEEAVGMLNEANAKLVVLDTALESYKSQVSDASTQLTGAQEAGVRDRTNQKVTAESSRASHASDLAQATEELKVANNELDLIQKAKTQLDTECSPQVETREDRMAKRDDEIKNLKEALSVLNGESIAPVGASLVDVGAKKGAEAKKAQPSKQSTSDVKAAMEKIFG